MSRSLLPRTDVKEKKCIQGVRLETHSNYVVDSVGDREDFGPSRKIFD